MTTAEKKILLIDTGREFHDIDRTSLSDRGFQLIVSSPAVNIQSLCASEDITFIITGISAHDAPDFFLRSDLPTNTPILAFGIETIGTIPFTGIVSCFPHSLTGSNLHSQVELLLKVSEITNQLHEKESQLKEISEKLDQQQQSMDLHSEFLDIVALRDGLTGMYNRRHLNTLLPKEFDNCVVNCSELTMLIIDIDYFYELNKSSGTSFGDFVLNDFAARLTAATQPDGLCFRFSGEIFIALMAGKSLAEATILAESIREELQQRPFIRNKEARTITISAGLVSLIDHRPENADEFISMAEQSLFAAKAEGRDRVFIFNQQDRAEEEPGEQHLRFLKETLSRILARTRISALDSLQVLAKNISNGQNRGHIENVRTYVDLLGRQMNLPESIIDTFKNAITLHTSIRFLLHNEMISKQELFTDDDREIMADFPFKLAEITELFDYFSNERAILLYHGERYDGSGYPEGLKGDEIPLGAKIFMLVDALAAMTEDRPHRRRLDPEQIISELTEGAGRQFDPSLVIRMLEVIEKRTLFDLPEDSIRTAITTINKSFPQPHHDNRTE